MVFLYILMGLSAIGIGIVFWLLKMDSEESQNDSVPENALENTQTPVESPEKLTSESKFTSQKEIQVETKTPNLREFYGNEKIETDEAIQNKDGDKASDQQILTDTASITTSPAQPSEVSNEKKSLSPNEEENIEREIELSAELIELKEKYDKLESMFDEKSTEYEKAKESLDNELGNRKEFNKVKDVLEKELKESKDRTRSAQGELKNTQTENENQKKRTEQLEEKTGQLEKDLLKKEDKIDDLVKRMQTFASPSTSAIPPKTENKKEGGTIEETSKTDQVPIGQPQERQPQADPPDEEAQTGKTSTQEKSVQSEETPPENQRTEKPPDSEKSEEEIIEKSKEKKGSEPSPSSEKPTHMGGFKLNLTIDEDSPEVEKSEKEDFLKLQPDVLSGDSHKVEPKETPDKPPQSPPENTPDDQKLNP